jgi:hypothetical protein
MILINFIDTHTPVVFLDLVTIFYFGRRLTRLSTWLVSQDIVFFLDELEFSLFFIL